jgi:integrase
VAEKAGITQPVTIETSNGGVKKKETFPKYKLVMSHTARRTGATLMYLAGIDAYDIIKITGHGDIDILKKYIKADHLDVVQKLTDKYDYFD